jgi:copper chaperone
MSTIALKTNINCGGCVARVTPALNATVGEGNWNVDTANPKKILTVTNDKVERGEVIKAVQKAGFRVEELT